MSLRDQLLTADTPAEIADVIDQYVRNEIVRIQTDASGNTVLVGADDVEYRLNRGSIILTAPKISWDGGAFGTNAVPTTATLTASELGTTVHWSVEVHNDFGRDAFKPGNLTGTTDATAEPSKIYLPPGCTQACINASLMFAAASGGVRWIRMTRNADQAHLSNMSIAEASAGAISQVVTLATGWINLDAGDYLEIHAIHNQGADVNLLTGGVANQGASSYFRVSFR